MKKIEKIDLNKWDKEISGKGFEYGMLDLAERMAWKINEQIKAHNELIDTFNKLVTIGGLKK